MSSIYWVIAVTLSVLGGLTALLVYISHLIAKATELRALNETLKVTEKYQDEVIKELSKPTTVTTVVDELHDGTF